MPSRRGSHLELSRWSGYDDDEYDDELVCTRCGGEGFAEVDDPLWDECDEFGWGPCNACRAPASAGISGCSDHAHPRRTGRRAEMLGDESPVRVSRDRRGLVCHGVVAGSAEPPAAPRSSASRARSEVVVQAPEHVGWQNGGGAGWRAVCGERLHLGPETTTGDGGGSGRSHEQAARVGSSSSTSARTRGKTFGFIEGLLCSAARRCSSWRCSA